MGMTKYAYDPKEIQLEMECEKTHQNRCYELTYVVRNQLKAQSGKMMLNRRALYFGTFGESSLP